MPFDWLTRKNKTVSGYRQHRLGVRIVVVTLACTLLFASLISALQIYRAYQLAVADAKAQSATIEKNYLPLLAAALWSVDEPRINALLDSVAQTPHVGQVKLHDDIGTTWTRNNDAQGQRLAHTKLALRYEDNQETFLLGQLHIELVDAHIIANLQHTAKRIALATLSTLLLCAIFILLIIHFWISRHLEKMARYAQTLDLTTLDNSLALDRPENSKADELDLVVEAINQMRLRIRDDLEKRSKLMHELNRHREQLEQLVDDRTKDLRQQTELLEQQADALREQNHELDAYAHTVAHDLKQPLTNLVASSTLLNAENLPLSDDKKKILLAGVQRSAQKMQAIIESLLLLASVRQADKIQREPLDIGNIAHEAYSRLQPLADQYHAQIKFNDSWPKALGHEQWVEEVWVNYLSNAIKYGGNSPLIVMGADMTESGRVKCWVKDFGTGLSEEQQAEMFDLFVRFDKKSTDGHGLGLSIVKRIAHALDGEVGYERSSDGGSVFWFSLPEAK